jgi:NAD(P)H-hydrate epimerase
MRDIQRMAQEDFAVDILQITENAGRSCATLVLAMLGGRGRGQRVVVLCGGGTKGASGIAAIRHMVNWGLVVEPVFGEVEQEMGYVARRQFQILRNAGIVEPVDGATAEMTIEEHLVRADLVVDALLGYGADGPPAGMAGALINLAVDAKRPVLALDMPTGVSAATGEPSFPAIRAITTLALDLPKLGLLEPAARTFVGDLYLADLGVPRTAYDRMGIALGAVFSDGPIVRLKR